MIEIIGYGLLTLFCLGGIIWFIDSAIDADLPMNPALLDDEVWADMEGKDLGTIRRELLKEIADNPDG